MIPRASVIFMIVCCVLALGASTLAGTAYAGPTAQEVKAASAVIAYDGRLATADGQIAQDGAYAFQFQLYAEPSGGEVVWSESVGGVVVEQGAFSTALGSQNPIPEALLGQKLWLAVAVRGPGESAFTELARARPSSRIRRLRQRRSLH